MCDSRVNVETVNLKKNHKLYSCAEDTLKKIQSLSALMILCCTLFEWEAVGTSIMCSCFKLM